jgi:hypothetical protein
MIKILRRGPLALFAALLFVAGSPTAHPRSAQQAGDQTKSDLPATKNASKPKKTDSLPQSVAGRHGTKGNSSEHIGRHGTGIEARQTSSGSARQRDDHSLWVNTDSGIYHKSGSRYYGKTKKDKKHDGGRRPQGRLPRSKKRMRSPGN